MTSKSNNLQAIEFVQSPRGQYILSQALVVAIDSAGDSSFYCPAASFAEFGMVPWYL